MIDVLLILRRFTAQISQFPNQDSWHLDDGYGNKPIYQAPPISNETFDYFLNEICYGDVNYSHVPSNAKTKPSVNLTTQGIKYIKNGLTFEVPLIITDSLVLGAMSLKMYIPEYLIYEGIRLPATLDSCSAVNIIDTTLYVGWLNPNGLSLNQLDTICTLVFTARDLQFYKHIEGISIDQITEIVDTSACVNGIVQLLQPRLVVSDIFDNQLSLQVFPNPAKDLINLYYFLPESGLVSIEITDMMGRSFVKLLEEYQNSNTYHSSYNSSNLPSGTYSIQFKFNDTVKTQKVVISH